CGQDTHWPWTF
nr:immunoglobulin light chain junction region [Macaca mulatta]MOW51643.1 immunoglobulin light chain junction region [Macaca mulatta]MOW52792.1 immunoglobulin light chain junction region [Macaca mulatta]MOW52811.1 immunoglobulin light chain junction region [Macaca mulatta]MOW54129.1 immunoglobulin light chain junction region [Macaca mulatta]